MSDSHATMAAEIARLREAPRQIEDKCYGPAWTIAHEALVEAGEIECATCEREAEERPPYYRALVWDEEGVTYRVGDGEPQPVNAWNVRLWFESGDSTHFHTDAPRRRRRA